MTIWFDRQILLSCSVFLLFARLTATPVLHTAGHILSSANLCYARLTVRQQLVVDSPLKQEEVEVVVALCQEVSQNSCGIARSNLIRRQTEVNAFHKVPELSHQVLIKAPADGQVGQRHRSDKTGHFVINKP